MHNQSNSLKAEPGRCRPGRIFMLAAVAVWLISGIPLEAQEANRLQFTVLHTNDEHSHFIPHPVADDHAEWPNTARGGAARIAAAIQAFRDESEQTGEPVLLFSGGDIMGGAPFGWLGLEGDPPELSLMQHLGYDAMVLGNHEFDFGPEVLAAQLRRAGYPDAAGTMALLCANLDFPPDHPLFDLGVEAYRILEPIPGFRIGVFGLLGRDAFRKTAYPGNAKHLDPVKTAQEVVELLQALDVDVIVALTHSGIEEDRELAQKVDGIHLIVGGHSHTLLEKPERAGETIVVQAGSNYRYLGALRLEFDRESGRLETMNSARNTPYILPADFNSPADSTVAELIAELERQLNDSVEVWTQGKVNNIRSVIMNASFPLMAGPPLQETELGNFIADAIRLSTSAVWGKPVEVAVQANGAIRSHVEPGIMSWSEGQITFYDLVLATGLGSGADGRPGFPVVAFYLTERELIRAMEASFLLSELLGNTYFLQYSGAAVEYDSRWSVAGRIPWSGQPLPLYRAVSRAKICRVAGIQTEDSNCEWLARDGDRLVAVATDYFIASFLPMVGKALPGLNIVFKNEHGEPIELDEAIVYHADGSQLKVWQTVVNHALEMPLNDDGIAVLSNHYSETGNRIVRVRFVPRIVIWVAITVPVLLLIAGWLVYRLWRRWRSARRNA